MTTLRNPTYHRRREERLRLDELMRTQRRLETSMQQLEARTVAKLNQAIASLFPDDALPPAPRSTPHHH